MNEELKDIIIASVALIFVFSYPEFLSDVSILAVSAIAIATGFVLHELEHRFVANKFGAAARFRLWKEGLMMALVFAVATNGSFVFAAPGAVVINNFRFYPVLENLLESIVRKCHMLLVRLCLT